jgi:hypothetical protein
MVSVLSGEIYHGIMIRSLPTALGIGSVRVVRDAVFYNTPIVRDRNTVSTTWQFFVMLVQLIAFIARTGNLGTNPTNIQRVLDAWPEKATEFG